MQALTSFVDRSANLAENALFTKNTPLPQNALAFWKAYI